jgi:hypothetical protein
MVGWEAGLLPAQELLVGSREGCEAAEPAARRRPEFVYM